ncbi:M-myrmeciitoxin-Mp2a [Formica fusca]
MQLSCLSLALAIIYIMAIVHGPRVEARATTTSDSSSSESWEVPAKPATPEQTVEAFALGIPTLLGGLYWTQLAWETMYNNSMHISSKIKSNPWLAETVQAYVNKSLTW